MDGINAGEPASWLEKFVLRESIQKNNMVSKQALFENFDAVKNEEQTKTELLHSNKITFMLKKTLARIKLFSSIICL